MVRRTAEAETKTKTKNKGGRPRNGRDEVMVRAESYIARRLKIAAEHRGVTVAVLLTEICEEPLRRIYAQAMKEVFEP